MAVPRIDAGGNGVLIDTMKVASGSESQFSVAIWHLVAITVVFQPCGKA